MQFYRSRKVEINFSDNLIYTDKYLQQRETVWEREVSKSEKRGLKIWNSKVYNLVSIEQKGETILLNVNMIEYKDMVFRMSQENTNNFQYDFHICPLAVNIVIKSQEGLLVVGKRSGQNYGNVGKYCFAGGSLNDEVALSTFKEVIDLAEIELEEEFQRGKIVQNDYIGLYYTESYVVFLFRYESGIEKEEIAKLPSTLEFVDYKALSLDGLRNLSIDMAYYMKPMLKLIRADDL